MFDWLQAVAKRLGYFIVHVPIYDRRSGDDSNWGAGLVTALAA
jgi:hypothetical protein